MDSYKLLMMNQGKAYGAKAAEEEIISTAKIESIDYNRDSVRSILKGYIQNQLKEDLEYDQMTLKEYIDPFTGEPVKAEIICDKPENNKFMILSTK